MSDRNVCRHLEIPDKYEKNVDTLGMFLKLQEELHQKIYNKDIHSFRKKNLGELYEFIRWNHLAISDEFSELYEALGGVDSHGSAIWKVWKSKHKEAQNKKFEDLTDAEKKELYFEVIDILHFVVNIMLAIGMDVETAVNMFISKNLENHDRVDRKY